MTSVSKILRRPGAFTLIELLVVILVIGILIAVAAPSFLGQADKAKKSAAKQELAVAYKAAKAAVIEEEGLYSSVGATSLAAAIQVSEPQFSAVASADAVDGKIAVTIGTGGQLELRNVAYASVVCTLTAPANAQVGVDCGAGTVLEGSGAALTETPVALTTSGGLITDASRSSGVQGDGRATDSSFGIWEATTNLVPNGGFETNTVGAGGNANAGVSQAATEAKYGSKSLLVEQAISGNFSAYLSGNLTVSALTTYTASFWVKAGVGAAPITLSVGLHNGTAYTLFDATPYSAPTAAWVRRTHTFTTAADTTTVRVFAATSATTGTGNTFYLDGVQLEQQPLATPYVETNGTTATRSAGRVQGPASAISSSQGWAAMRVRMGWASASPPHAYSAFFAVGDASDDGLFLYYTGGYWVIERYNTGVGTQLYLADSFARGDTVTIIARWTATETALSVDGSPFIVQSNTNIPTLTTSTFDIGTGGVHCCIGSSDSDSFWSAAGSGTLTNSQAAQLAGYTDPPNLGLMPGTATFRWAADDATAYVR